MEMDHPIGFEEFLPLIRCQEIRLDESEQESGRVPLVIAL